MSCEVTYGWIKVNYWIVKWKKWLIKNHVLLYLEAMRVDTGLLH